MSVAAPPIGRCPRCHLRCPERDDRGDINCILCGETIQLAPNPMDEIRRQATADIRADLAAHPVRLGRPPLSNSEKIHEAWIRGDYDRWKQRPNSWLPEHRAMLQVLLRQRTDLNDIARMLTERYGVPRTPKACRQEARKLGLSVAGCGWTREAARKARGA